MSSATFTQNYFALFDTAGEGKNYRKAVPHFLVAAKNGHPHAQNLVGYCYDLGYGPRRNARSAVHWYKKAAKNGYAEAIYNLALSYAHGRGISKDERKAFSLNRQAATIGHIWSHE